MYVGRTATVDMETYVIHTHAQLCTCAECWLSNAWSETSTWGAGDVVLHRRTRSACVCLLSRTYVRRSTHCGIRKRLGCCYATHLHLSAVNKIAILRDMRLYAPSPLHGSMSSWFGCACESWDKNMGARMKYADTVRCLTFFRVRMRAYEKDDYYSVFAMY